MHYLIDLLATRRGWGPERQQAVAVCGVWPQAKYLLLLAKKVSSPKPAQPSTPRPHPGFLAPRGGSLDGRGWVYAPGADWGARYCQLTALTPPRGVSAYI